MSLSPTCTECGACELHDEECQVPRRPGRMLRDRDLWQDQRDQLKFGASKLFTSRFVVEVWFGVAVQSGSHATSVAYMSEAVTEEKWSCKLLFSPKEIVYPEVFQVLADPELGRHMRFIEAASSFCHHTCVACAPLSQRALETSLKLQLVDLAEKEGGKADPTRGLMIKLLRESRMTPGHLIVPFGQGLYTTRPPSSLDHAGGQGQPELARGLGEIAWRLGQARPAAPQRHSRQDSLSGSEVSSSQAKLGFRLLLPNILVE